MNIMITGAAGYIGSHAALILLEQGHKLICLDNLSNSTEKSIRSVEEISGAKLDFINEDIRNTDSVRRILADNRIESVMHFAALKSIEESNLDPLRYYDNNVGGLISLVGAMREADVRSIIFSSSATVYGNPRRLPIDEAHPMAPTNPYGRTKSVAESFLRDLGAADPRWQIAILRYFNPVGAHPSGLLGDSPFSTPSNIMPLVCRVASRKIDEIKILGDDYDTHDGTGVRDYIHILDLISGHLAALTYIKSSGSGVNIWNLGTGRGHSVKEVLETFERVNKVAIPHSVTSRRKGDVAACYASCMKALVELGWKAEYGLEAMCESAWLHEQSSMKKQA